MTYDYSDPGRQLRFKCDLAKSEPELDYNLLRKYGLIQKAKEGTPSFKIKSAVREYILCEDAQGNGPKQIEFIVEEPLLGPAWTGIQEPPLPSYINKMHTEKLRTADFRMPVEPLGGFEHMPHSEAQSMLVDRIRGWLDCFNFEMQIIVAAGMRGIEKGWMNGWLTFPKQQDGSCELSTLPQPIRYLSKMPEHEVSVPRLHSAEWQTCDQMKNHEVDYTTAARAPSFIEALEALHEYLEPRYSKDSAHYGIDPAIVRLPKEVLGSEEDEEVEQYTLFISQQRADEIRYGKEWKAYQEQRLLPPFRDRLGKIYGRYGFSYDYVGRYKNIVVVANPITPIFKMGKHKLSRGLLFGNQALVTAFTESNEGLPEGIRSPFKCEFVPINGGNELGVDVAFRMGVKKMVHRLTPDSVTDCGIVAFDMYEGSTN